MKVLIIHNFYQIAGGEDSVLENEIDLLENHGNSIIHFTVDNTRINSFFEKFTVMFNVPFSFFHYRKVKSLLLKENPDVVHVHNYFPLLSPSIFFACKSANVPVVHTLHNYRAVCPTALLMSEGMINEKSLKGKSWWTVYKRVYRNSFVGSLALASMVELHKWIGTWQTKVDRFIALTEFSRQKYIEAGWPGDKIVVKPNFISDPFENEVINNKKDGYALYVGRLSEEKGINVLLDAWGSFTFPLKIIGDGLLNNLVSINSLSAIEYLGQKDKEDVLKFIKNADFIVMPSTCYETFGMVIIEAFSCGTPVIVSRLGSLESIVKNRVTGLHFEVGNHIDLAQKVQWMIDNPEQVSEMGKNARQEYLAKYTANKNYPLLLDIYKQAIDEAKRT